MSSTEENQKPYFTDAYGTGHEPQRHYKKPMPINSPPSSLDKTTTTTQSAALMSNLNKKNLTWASIASQPAKPNKRNNIAMKKKTPGMPPPPMIPEKHALNVNPWDYARTSSPTNNQPSTISEFIPIATNKSSSAAAAVETVPTSAAVAAAAVQQAPPPQPTPTSSSANEDDNVVVSSQKWSFQVSEHQQQQQQHQHQLQHQQQHQHQHQQHSDFQSNRKQQSNNTFNRNAKSYNNSDEMGLDRDRERERDRGGLYQKHYTHHHQHQHQQHQHQHHQDDSQNIMKQGGGGGVGGGPSEGRAGGNYGRIHNVNEYSSSRRPTPGGQNQGQQQQPDSYSKCSETDTQIQDYRDSEIVLQQLKDRNNYNPIEMDLQNTNLSRYFVIKSYSEDDIHRSIKYEIWCSTDHGNKKLDEAFTERMKVGGCVMLFFSVNGSGHFCGMAQMMTPVDYKSTASVWSQDKWKGKFKVKWIYVKDVPNNQLRYIKLENNENKSVTHSRDTQEIPLNQGLQMLKIFHTYKHLTSIFDDFFHYEKRQEQSSSSSSSSAVVAKKPPSSYDNHNVHGHSMSSSSSSSNAYNNYGDNKEHHMNNDWHSSHNQNQGNFKERGNYGRGGVHFYVGNRNRKNLNQQDMRRNNAQDAQQQDKPSSAIYRAGVGGIGGGGGGRGGNAGNGGNGGGGQLQNKQPPSQQQHHQQPQQDNEDTKHNLDEQQHSNPSIENSAS